MKKALCTLAILLMTASYAEAKRIYEYTNMTAPASTDELLISDTSDSNREFALTLDVLTTYLNGQLDVVPDGTATNQLLQWSGTAWVATSTLSGITIDADDNTLQDMPKDISWAVGNPTATDAFYVKLNRAMTLSEIGCVVDPEGSGESVVVDILECDSNGDNCVSTLSATITCGNTPTAGTISDTAWASGAFIKISLGTVTGTVKSLTVYGAGKETL